MEKITWKKNYSEIILQRTIKGTKGYYVKF